MERQKQRQKKQQTPAEGTSVRIRSEHARAPCTEYARAPCTSIERTLQQDGLTPWRANEGVGPNSNQDNALKQSSTE